MSVGSILNLLNEWIKNNVMWASGKYNIISFNEFNKLSNESTQIKYSISCIPKKKLLLIVKKDLFFNMTLM